MTTPATNSRRMLDLAARLALRAAGDVEPNPMVGAVIVDRAGCVLGMGHHRRFGGPHAEVEALRDCEAKGNDPRGGTIYVTLEPCDHTGKTPPCTGAILRAGIARVVIARVDPNPVSAGGAEHLRREGVAVEVDPSSELAVGLAAPFVKRVRSSRDGANGAALDAGLPWVIAKWAQTLDGRIATRTGESKWISGAASRRHVHRARARVDVILTGIGTVLADDPRLTARGVARIRRVARRVVVDPNLELPADCRLLETLQLAPLTVACSVEAISRRPGFAAALKQRGVDVLTGESATKPATQAGHSGRPHLNLEAILRHLASVHDAMNVLVEAGPGLLGSLFAADLVDETHVYIAPVILGDPGAPGPVQLPGPAPELLRACKQLELRRVRRVGPDVLMVYRRAQV